MNPKPLAVGTGQIQDERFAGMGARVDALAEAALTLASKSGL